MSDTNWALQIKRHILSFTNELPHEKTNNVVSEQVRHKRNCTSTEDGCRLLIVDLESRGIVLSV